MLAKPRQNFHHQKKTKQSVFDLMIDVVKDETIIYEKQEYQILKDK